MTLIRGTVASQVGYMRTVILGTVFDYISRARVEEPVSRVSRMSKLACSCQLPMRIPSQAENTTNNIHSALFTSGNDPTGPNPFEKFCCYCICAVGTPIEYKPDFVENGRPVGWLD